MVGGSIRLVSGFVKRGGPATPPSRPGRVGVARVAVLRLVGPVRRSRAHGKGLESGREAPDVVHELGRRQQEKLLLEMKTGEKTLIQCQCSLLLLMICLNMNEYVEVGHKQDEVDCFIELISNVTMIKSVFSVRFILSQTNMLVE